MTRMQYTAIVERDRGWYVMHCVELEGVSAYGPSMEAAEASLAEAIQLALARKQLESGEVDEDDLDVSTEVVH